jgi:predicted nucleic acid-binding protein
VLLDVITHDPEWHSWSAQALATALRHGAVNINPLIYAEVSTLFADITELDTVLAEPPLRRLPLPFSAGFLAAKAFKAYRRGGGERGAPLPDFYIGAHAVVQNLTLVTRDVRRYRTYFPTLRLVAPDA